MKDVDDAIRAALEREQLESLDDEDWQAHYESLLGLFRGGQAWLAWTHVAMSVLMITLIVVSAIQFFRVESTQALIGWAVGFTLGVLLQAMIEWSFLAEWSRYVLRRDIKHVELQVATLVERLRRDSATADE